MHSLEIHLRFLLAFNLTTTDVPKATVRCMNPIPCQIMVQYTQGHLTHRFQYKMNQCKAVNVNPNVNGDIEQPVGCFDSFGIHFEPKLKKQLCLNHCSVAWFSQLLRKVTRTHRFCGSVLVRKLNSTFNFNNWEVIITTKMKPWGTESEN